MSRVGSEFTILKSVDTPSGRTEPQYSRDILINGKHEVIGEALFCRKGGKRLPIEAAEARSAADPNIALMVGESTRDELRR